MIIAVDFDGVLCRNAFPAIGDPNYTVISFVRQLIDQGHEVILWTSRNGEELDAAVDWCADRGLHFCAVNDNAPSNRAEFDGKYKTPSRKIYADVYVDDHNMECVLENSKLREYAMSKNLMKGIEKWKTKANLQSSSEDNTVPKEKEQ